VIVGVCDTDPVAAGLIAHYLSVALDVLVRTEGINARVGVLEPYTRALIPSVRTSTSSATER